MSYVPEGWRSVRLIETGTWLSGGTPFTDEPRYWDGEIPWISAASLKSFRLSSSNRCITPLGAKAGTQLVPRGSVIFVVRGMSLKSEFRIGVTERQVAFGQDCKAIIPGPGINGRFLALALKARSQQILGMVDEAGHGTGRLPTDLISKLAIGIPELAEQLQIAEIFDSVDDSARTRREIARKVSLASSRIVDKYFQELAAGCAAMNVEHKTLEAIGALDRPFLKTGPFGSSLKGDDWVEQGVPVITIGSLGDGYISEDQLLHVSEKKASFLHEYRLVEGDIVFSRVADVGRSAVVMGEQSGWLMSSNLMRISVDPKMAIPGYVQLVIAHYAPLRDQIRMLTNASGREVVNDAIMRKLRLPWVPIPDQQGLMNLFDEFRGMAAGEERALAKLDVLKQGLMDDLLTGRVRVTDAGIERVETG